MSSHAGLMANYADLERPYSASGFSTRMRWRVASLGAHSASKSNRTGSSGLVVSLGCGQLLPHTSRSGAACTYALTDLVHFRATLQAGLLPVHLVKGSCGVRKLAARQARRWACQTCKSSPTGITLPGAQRFVYRRRDRARGWRDRLCSSRRGEEVTPRLLAFAEDGRDKPLFPALSASTGKDADREDRGCPRCRVIARRALRTQL